MMIPSFEMKMIFNFILYHKSSPVSRLRENKKSVPEYALDILIRSPLAVQEMPNR